MKRLIIIIIILGFILIVEFCDAQKPPHHAVLFDITGSMIGRPDPNLYPDIWYDAVDLFYKQLKSFPPDEYVSLYFFGQDFHTIVENVKLTDEQTYTEIFEKVKNFDIHTESENYTCTWMALSTLFGKLDTAKYINYVYLFSDGNPTSPGVGNCGSLSAMNIRNMYYEKTSKESILAIYNLNNTARVNLGDDQRILEIDRPFNILHILISPVNKNIKFFKDEMMCQQSFRIYGTGIDYLDQLSPFDQVAFFVSNDSNSEQLRVSSEIKPSQIWQTLEFSPVNPLETINEGNYVGPLNYTINNHRDYIINIDSSTSVKVNIVGDSEVKFIYKDKPWVKINLVDNN